MFMGWLLNGETYSRTEICAVVLISLGVALFTIKPKDLVTFGLQGAAVGTDSCTYRAALCFVLFC
jgi:drug/metabolite transporter (DMT)-like permease